MQLLYTGLQRYRYILIRGSAGKLAFLIPDPRGSIVLKLEKVWTAVTPKVATSGQLMKDSQKRETLPFKMLFYLFLNDFRFSRYHRVKKRLIFNRFVSLTRISRSHSCDRSKFNEITGYRVAGSFIILAICVKQSKETLNFVISRQPIKISEWNKKWFQ